MSRRQFHKSLSPRASKLLVEMVIGVIGVLGIMTALAVEPEAKNTLYQLKHHGEVMSVEAGKVAPQIDWIDILF